ncbi:hypothetical protein IEQ34_017052 [Dendrobium chrysotoxum]|uniref:Uncharacterized protein n=1 Tax=Dendrobium chrysotoxum TaxID=161865 RepID=A0AAV7GHC9_DENCH|nr:hypothetical protein IEQ34_017052 [Dendrobium chrysotoxum]
MLRLSLCCWLPGFWIGSFASCVGGCFWVYSLCGFLLLFSICGLCLAVSLTCRSEEILSLATPFKYALIGKFLDHRPVLDSIHKIFSNLKLISDSSVTLLNPTHFLIKLVSDLDYSRVFLMFLTFLAIAM